ncbi:hypothetical protein [Desulfobotulus sp.]|jgi:hypothetical protein|uniref:hypothetical protein n=1 Tax=Desulfobotulus sp. TaxID=1940337 RepID=UPI002A35ECAA|nr:hypothetical protein [Desulfobotulus sp.]MDY0162039.1 hypothetical protein [Desulfobotulus sp.]
MRQSKGKSWRVWFVLGIWTGLLLVSALGCATRNQVLWHKSPAIRSANLIPGVEPEESAVKLMVRVQGQGLAPEKGSPARRRYYAERAAVLDGYRRLSERIAGILLDSYTLAGEGEMGQDRILSETRAYLRGAQVMEVAYSEGMATAEVRVFLVPRQSVFQWDGTVASP